MADCNSLTSHFFSVQGLKKSILRLQREAAHSPVPEPSLASSALLVDSAPLGHLASSGGALKRLLTARDLTLLGIGCIIGSGIYVLTGVVAATASGPGLVLSMLIAAMASALCGLCYAELAAMIPVSGSAYSYAYASMGEIWAWLIGWDLILEYGLAVACVGMSSACRVGWGR